jgi:hypothetical protein
VTSCDGLKASAPRHGARMTATLAAAPPQTVHHQYVIVFMDWTTKVEDAFRQAGVRYPGASTGRMDIDDNFWAAALRIARRYAYPWWGW